MFLSEIYDVYDCVKYDSGILGTATNIYETLDANSKFERKSEYSSLTKLNTSNAVLKLFNIPNDCVVDFEFCQVDSTQYQQIFGCYLDSSWKTHFTLANIGFTLSDIGQWLKIRLSTEDGKVRLTNIDNPTQYTEKDIGSGYINRFYWISQNASELRIRNVKVYPI